MIVGLGVCALRIVCVCAGHCMHVMCVTVRDRRYLEFLSLCHQIACNTSACYGANMPLCLQVTVGAA